MSPEAIARCAAATTGPGVGKSGSPISIWTTVRPAASSARAAVCTSITWNGSMAARRDAVERRSSIVGRTPCRLEKRMVMPAPPAPPRWSDLSMTRTTHIALAVSLLAPLAAASIARADVYKCAGTGNVPIYQEEPCPKGKELRNFQVDPPEITVVPATPRSDAIPAAKAPPKAPAAKSNDAKQGKSTLAGDASERKFVRTGMSEAEVLAKLGQPDMTVGG